MTRESIEVPWPGSPTRPDGLPPAELADDDLPEDPAGRTVITAEWALWGKEPHETGYHVLRCSDGTLRAKDFSEVITRYSPGELRNLPQCTMSWIPGKDHQPEYLALGFHQLAPVDPRHVEDGSRRDAVGREIVFVRLYCMRFSALAEHRAGYQDLVKATDRVLLTEGAHGPVTLALPAERAEVRLHGTDRRLAEQVATLLLTSRRVCILGADNVPLAERLRFIDSVMALLPYGLRAAMSAATWAGSTSANLNFRLFFSGAPRVGSAPPGGRPGAGDLLVHWGHPETAPPATGDVAVSYQGWLKDARGQAVELLAEEGRVSPVRFSEASLRRLVGTLPLDKSIEATLDDLGRSFKAHDTDEIKSAIKRMRRHLVGARIGAHGPANLADYQHRISKGGLLRDHKWLLPFSALKRELYEVLLPLAFGDPLTYRAYCTVETCAGGYPLSTSLQTALTRVKTAAWLPWILARGYGPDTRSPKLLEQLHDLQVRSAEPLREVVEAVEGGELRREHGLAVVSFAVRYLRKYNGDPDSVLAQYGYLARVYAYLYPHDVEEQIERITRLLNDSFPGLLSRPDVDAIVSQSALQPTPAFEEALASKVDRRDRRYVADCVADAIRLHAGFPSSASVGGPRSKRSKRSWLPWPRRRRRRRQRPPTATQSDGWPYAGPLPGAAPRQQTAQLPVSTAPLEESGPRPHVLSRKSVWALPRTTLVVAVIIVVVLIAVAWYVLHFFASF